MFGRVLVEVRVLNPELFTHILPMILSMGGVAMAYALFVFFRQRSSEKGDLDISNPLDLKSAIRFGIVFVLVLLVSRAAQIYFGNTGILISSLVSGLADVDAIALSVSELSRSGGLEVSVASQAVIIATAANTLSKGVIVLAGGDSKLRKVILPGLVLILASAVISVFMV
jgi:uncharacterized membrane protein (DUF4010 family)